MGGAGGGDAELEGAVGDILRCLRGGEGGMVDTMSSGCERAHRHTHARTFTLVSFSATCFCWCSATGAHRARRSHVRACVCAGPVARRMSHGAGDAVAHVAPLPPLTAAHSFVAGVIERYNAQADAAAAKRAPSGAAGAGAAAGGGGGAFMDLDSRAPPLERKPREWVRHAPRCAWGGVCAHLVAAADFGVAVEAWCRVRQVRARAAAVTRALADAGWGDLAVGLFEWLRALPVVVSSAVPGARGGGGGGVIDAAVEDVGRACEELFGALAAVRAARDDADSITALGVLAAYLEDGHVDTPFGSRIVHPAAVVELAGLCAHGVLG